MAEVIVGESTSGDIEPTGKQALAKEVEVEVEAKAQHAKREAKPGWERGMPMQRRMATNEDEGKSSGEKRAWMPGERSRMRKSRRASHKRETGEERKRERHGVSCESLTRYLSPEGERQFGCRKEKKAYCFWVCDLDPALPSRGFRAGGVSAIE